MQDSDFDSRNATVNTFQNGDLYAPTNQGKFNNEHEQTYQECLLAYITQTHATLRPYTEPDALQKAIALTLSKLPGFGRSEFYVYDVPNFYQIWAEENNAQLAQSCLQTVPLSMTILRELMSDTYRVGQVYCIPTNAPFNANEQLKQLFQSTVHANETIGAVQGTLLEELIIVPLYRDGAMKELSGLFIFAGALQPQVRTTETYLLLELLASHTGILMERARLHEEIHKISEERIALSEVSHALSTPDAVSDMQKVYRTLYEEIKKLMPVDLFFIDNYDNVRSRCSNVYMVENDIPYLSTEYNYTPFFLNQLIWSEEGYLLCATAMEFMQQEQIGPDRSQNAPELLWYRRVIANVQSSMFVVIKYGGEPVGIISVYGNQGHSYQQEHLHILKEIGIQAALAIKCAQMYSALRIALEQAQESEYLKNRFLMTVAHELRTPLTAVQGYLDLLESFGKGLSEQQKERFINNASRACEELVLLLGNVMDASRIDQDKVELKFASLHIIEAIRTTVEIFNAIITKEQRPVEIYVPERLFVWGDELRLRQILLNLVSNALKYTPAPTKIQIRAVQMTYQDACEQFVSFKQATNLSEQKDYAIIAVQDWGPGVAVEDQARLFTKFMRLNGALNSTQRGAGLGLYLCRQLTEAMGGSIWMESTDPSGQGAAFVLALPLTNEF